jgi:uncharacterized membrane protein YccC
MIGTFVGSVAIVLMSALLSVRPRDVPHHLSLWGGACTFAATLLRNFAAYAALAGYTAVGFAMEPLTRAGQELGLTIISVYFDARDDR